MTVSTLPRPARPVPVERAAVVWWTAFGCWFTGSVLGQVAHGPAAIAVPYAYARLQPGPAAVVLFGLCAVFLGSLVLPMRDGARWSRPVLTLSACPLAVLLAWQFERATMADTATSVTQAMLSLVALIALPVAVGLMYSAEVRRFFARA